MKNALIIINFLLVIAVGFLLYKQFSVPDKADQLATKQNSSGDSLANKKILLAYIDMDSIKAHYEEARIAEREIQRKGEAVQVEIGKMDKALKDKVQGYQQKSKTMTEEEANAAGQDIQMTQNQMAEKQRNLTEDYNSFVENITSRLKKNIQDYLKVFNADKTYTFIITYEPELFYYSDKAYDITPQVLKGLNERYKTISKK